MTEKKYKLSAWSKKTGLRRVIALRDFGNVKAGDVGGWINRESNLSHEGDCWVSDNAAVYDNAWVCGNALVCGNARVYGNALVCDNAKVSGNAWVADNSEITAGEGKQDGSTETV